MGDDIDAFESLIEKYETNKYDYTDYAEQQEKIRRAKKRLKSTLRQLIIFKQNNSIISVQILKHLRVLLKNMK
jgi:hypothetical protein